MYFWYCNVCKAQNHESDGECQFCECGGTACMRDNCSGSAHFSAMDGEVMVEDIVEFLDTTIKISAQAYVSGDVDDRYVELSMWVTDDSGRVLAVESNDLQFWSSDVEYFLKEQAKDLVVNARNYSYRSNLPWRA